MVVGEATYIYIVSLKAFHWKRIVLQLKNLFAVGNANFTKDFLCARPCNIGNASSTNRHVVGEATLIFTYLSIFNLGRLAQSYPIGNRLSRN